MAYYFFFFFKLIETIVKIVKRLVEQITGIRLCNKPKFR